MAGRRQVITWLFDVLHEIHPDSVLLDFTGGPKGIMMNRCVELEAATIDRFRNTGSFDMIQAGRDNIQSEEQMLASLRTVTEKALNVLVIISGDDSNINAAILAEFFAAKASKCAVVGVPKTIDGDLQNEYI